MVSFGAFVDLGNGVEGLVHISEMPGGEATRSSLQPELKVTVRVLEIDDLQQRISLAIPYAASVDHSPEPVDAVLGTSVRPYRGPA